jgi:hypothetical protein
MISWQYPLRFPPPPQIDIEGEEADANDDEDNAFV